MFCVGRATEMVACSWFSACVAIWGHWSLGAALAGAAVAVVFVAKSEVANWPLFGQLAKLQRTVFVERERRHKTGDAARAMSERLLSIAQLTALPLAPPALVQLTADAGCRVCGLRLLPTSPGGPAYPLMNDAALLAETLARIVDVEGGLHIGIPLALIPRAVS